MRQIKSQQTQIQSHCTNTQQSYMEKTICLKHLCENLLSNGGYWKESSQWFAVDVYQNRSRFSKTGNTQWESIYYDEPSKYHKKKEKILSETPSRVNQLTNYKAHSFITHLVIKLQAHSLLFTSKVRNALA